MVCSKQVSEVVRGQDALREVSKVTGCSGQGHSYDHGHSHGLGYDYGHGHGHRTQSSSREIRLSPWLRH